MSRSAITSPQMKGAFGHDAAPDSCTSLRGEKKNADGGRREGDGAGSNEAGRHGKRDASEGRRAGRPERRTLHASILRPNRHTFPPMPVPASPGTLLKRRNRRTGRIRPPLRMNAVAGQALSRRDRVAVGGRPRRERRPDEKPLSCDRRWKVLPHTIPILSGKWPGRGTARKGRKQRGRPCG